LVMAAEDAVERRERVRLWLMLIAGTAVATLEAWFVATRLRTPPKYAADAHFWVGAFFWAVVWVGMSVSGGAVAAWLAGLLVRGSSAVSADRVWRAAAVGWALLPCLTVMAVRGSWWVLPAVTVAAAATVFRMRPLFHTAGEKMPRATVADTVMSSLSGLPPMGGPPMRSLLVAICAQLCLLFAAGSAMGRAGVALAAAVALLIAGWTAWDGRWARRWRSDRVAMPLGALAVVLLMLVLTQWMGGGGGTSAVAAGSGTGGGPRAGDLAAGQSGTDYAGVILWPPHKKKVEIAPPRPKTALLGQSVGRKPLVIPFDGPYWYFKAPMTEPGAKAHVTVGESTKANVRSTNWMPLRMEAHQNLGLPIDLDCCREIDMKVTNADNRAGRIDIALVLTDSASPGGRRLMLDDEPVVSSLGAGAAALDRAPVTETLRFVIPKTTRLLRFDEIDVIVQPSVERAKLGSRVAVEEFELVPR
jgi:hypothetical protein